MVRPLWVSTQGYLVAGHVIEIAVDGYLIFENIIPSNGGAEVIIREEDGGRYNGRRKPIVNVDYEQELILDEDDDLVLSLIQDFVRWQ